MNEYYMVVWKDSGKLYGHCFYSKCAADEYRDHCYQHERRVCQNQRLRNPKYSYDNMGMYAVAKTQSAYGMKVYGSFADIPLPKFSGEEIHSLRTFTELEKPNFCYFAAINVDYEDENAHHHTEYDIGVCFSKKEDAEKYCEYARSPEAPKNYDGSNVVNDDNAIRVVVANDNYGWGDWSKETFSEVKRCGPEDLPYEYFESDESKDETVYIVVEKYLGYTYGVFTTENIAEYMKNRMLLDNPTGDYRVIETKGRRFLGDADDEDETTIPSGTAVAPNLNVQGVKLAEYFMTLDDETQTAFLTVLREKGLLSK